MSDPSTPTPEELFERYGESVPDWFKEAYQDVPIVRAMIDRFIDDELPEIDLWEMIRALVMTILLQRKEMEKLIGKSQPKITFPQKPTQEIITPSGNGKLINLSKPKGEPGGGRIIRPEF